MIRNKFVKQRGGSVVYSEYNTGAILEEINRWLDSNLIQGVKYECIGVSPREKYSGEPRVEVFLADEYLHSPEDMLLIDDCENWCLFVNQFKQDFGIALQFPYYYWHD